MLIGTLRADVTVVNAGLQSGMGVPPGVTLNPVMTSTNSGHQPQNLPLLTATGTASGLSLTASSAGWAMGGGGSFSPIGAPAYAGSSNLVDHWIANLQAAYGSIWQAGANSLGGNQTLNLTLSGLSAFTDYSITLLSVRGNTYAAIENPGTIGLTYGGSTTGIATAFQGAGNLSETTLSMATSAGSTSGLNAREITWTFTTGANTRDVVVTLTGAWNFNALIISSTPVDSFGITSFEADDHYVAPGSTVTLAWEAAGAETLAIDPFPGTVTGSSVEVTVNETTTFTLTATKGGDVTTAMTRVATGPPRPNLVVVLVDDMGVMDTSVPFLHDRFESGGQSVVHPLNQRYRTPNMESLAAAGMKFTQAYAANVCTPSRISLMTGLNPTRHHTTTWTALASPQDTGDPPTAHRLLPPENWGRAGVDPGRSGLLPRMLHQTGYRTIHTGKGHFGPNSEEVGDPCSIGFEVNIAGSGLGGPGSYLGSQNFVKNNPAHQVPGMVKYHGQDIFLTEALTLEFNREIDRAVADGVPFFGYLSHYAVHATFEDPDPRFTANYPNLTGYQRNFATLVEGMDKSLGDVLAKLRQSGQAANTLVVFVGDNGSDAPIPFGPGQVGPAAPLRGMKTHAYEGGLRVPMLVAWAEPNPANPFQQALPIPQGGTCHDLTTIWDLMPTLLDVAGATVPSGLDGQSITPSLRGEPGLHRPAEFILNFPHSHQYEDFYVMMRSGRWKLIYRYLSGNYELYDLENDLAEQHNLAADPTHAQQVMTLGRHMIRELKRLDYQPPRDRLAAGNPEVPVLLPMLASVDTDCDGLADVIEDPNRNGIVDPGETNPENTDTDSDGTPDRAEVRLGTNPLDPSSAFRANITPARETIILTWPSQPGNYFTIHGSTDLTDWSEVIATGIPASPGTTTSRDLGSPAGLSRFFRVSLDP